VLWSNAAAEQEAGKKELLTALELVEREGLGKLSGAGPYWFGQRPSLVDFTFYPWFERLQAFERHTGFETPRALERVHRFWQALSEREAVKAIENSTEFYLERYRARKPAAAPAASR
jgi:glutathione S-transferase